MGVLAQHSSEVRSCFLRGTSPPGGSLPGGDFTQSSCSRVECPVPVTRATQLSFHPQHVLTWGFLACRTPILLPVSGPSARRHKGRRIARSGREQAHASQDFREGIKIEIQCFKLSICAREWRCKRGICLLPVSLRCPGKPTKDVRPRPARDWTPDRVQEGGTP